MNSKKKFILLIIFVVISFLVAILSGYFGLNINSITSFFAVNHWLAAVLYTLLFFGLAVFSFSVSVMTSLGTLLFSWQEVVIYTMIGLLASSIVHFFISRKLGKDYVRNYLEKRGSRIEKFDKIVEKDTFKTILIWSAIFFVPPTLAELLGGVINIDFKKFFLATFLGNFPNTFFTVYLVNGLLYSSMFQIYTSIIGLIATTAIALYFYNGEISDILKLSFPKLFERKK